MLNLTIPKTKDLVHRPVEQYNDIINIIKKSPGSGSKKTSKKATFHNDVVNEGSSDMKNELKNFIKQKMSNAKTVDSLPLGGGGVGTGDLNNGFSSAGNYYEF